MQPAAVPDDEAPDFDPAAASSQHDSMDVVEEQPDGGAAGERVLCSLINSTLGFQRGRLC